MISPKDSSLLGSLYKCLSSLLSIAFPFQASEQGLSGLHEATKAEQPKQESLFGGEAA